MLADSVVLWRDLHLKGKFVSLANIVLVNKHSKSKIIPFTSCSVPGACSLCEKVRFSRIRTSWCQPEALMLEENVKGGGFSYPACATGTLDPSGCREAPQSLTLWGSSGSDSLYVSKVQLKSSFPPRWELLVKTRCPHRTATCTAPSPEAQPQGTTHPTHPAPAVKAHGQQEAGPTLEALGTAVHSGRLWPVVSTEPYSKDARPDRLLVPREVFFLATSGPWLRCPLLFSDAASRRCHRPTGVLAL